MHPKLQQEGERVEAPGSCCYGQLNKAHFLQGSLSFESQHRGPPMGPTEFSAQHRCCPRFPAPLAQKAVGGDQPSHSYFAHYRSPNCLWHVADLQKTSSREDCMTAKVDSAFTY